MRLFIAAELPEEMLDALVTTQAELRDTLRGRYVAPDMLHVTLAFLGDVPGALVPDVVGVLEVACAGADPIDASLGELGYFGRSRKATLWQAVDGGVALVDLAETVRAQLRLGGFSFDEKEFKAHVTLMRAADLECAGELPMPHIACGPIDAITLFSSDLSGPHPVYEPLHRVKLG